MTSAIVVHADFDHAWPWAADRMRDIWKEQGALQFVRLPREDTRPCHAVLDACDQISRLALFGVPFTEPCRSAMPALREIAANLPHDAALAHQLRETGVRMIWQKGEGFWGQSVAEFALALTICGLRRIPQT